MLKPNAHVLVTANSNSACDEIAIRLLNFVKRHELYRLYSPSFERPEKKDRLHPVLKPLSNLRKDTNEFPTYEEIYCYKIVVSTLVSSLPKFYEFQVLNFFLIPGELRSHDNSQFEKGSFRLYSD